MTLEELTEKVYIETNRPDLVAETTQALLEATLSCHIVDFFNKDITEARVVFDEPTWYVQELDLSALPRYRAMAYVRKTDTTVAIGQQTNTLPTGESSVYGAERYSLLKRIDINDIFDMYGDEKRNVYYASGQQLNMKSSTPLSLATIGWYQFPSLTPTAYKSWIANEQPYVIIYKAAGTIFAKTGDDKSASTYMRQPIPGRGEDTGGLYYQQLALLRRSNTVAEGY